MTIMKVSAHSQLESYRKFKKQHHRNHCHKSHHHHHKKKDNLNIDYKNNEKFENDYKEDTQTDTKIENKWLLYLCIKFYIFKN